MFNIFNTSRQSAEGVTSVKLKIKGMHCASCALNIDGALEDELSVERAETSYARAESRITFDPQKVKLSQIQATIKQLGYETEVIS
jgi:copper chaperone CopZ